MNQTEIYYHSGEYARDHGELDAWRRSYWDTVAVRHAVEEAIRNNFDGYRLNRSALNVISEYDPERVALVLAAAVLDKPYDGRFSRDNRNWAATVRIPDGMYERLHNIGADTHPAILDGYITLFRQATTEGR